MHFHSLCCVEFGSRQIISVVFDGRSCISSHDLSVKDGRVYTASDASFMPQLTGTKFRINSGLVPLQFYWNIQLLVVAVNEQGCKVHERKRCLQQVMQVWQVRRWLDQHPRYMQTHACTITSPYIWPPPVPFYESFRPCVWLQRT